VTGEDVAKRIKKLGGVKLRQNGSHARWECPCGQHKTTVPMHKKDLGTGLVIAIEKDLSCLGAKWLRG
jgi:predicted RNA binding protein YcfA (HicA-like mRNA interferase family)